MSYAGKVTSARTARPVRATGRTAASTTRAAAGVTRPRGASGYQPSSPESSELDVPRLVALGAGLALGALIGAATALLLAPQSGEETREDIARSTRAIRERAGDAWDELRWSGTRGRRHLRHGVTRGRWALDDLFGG